MKWREIAEASPGPDRLMESRSAPLFHFTDLNHLVRILDSNSLRGADYSRIGGQDKTQRVCLTRDLHTPHFFEKECLLVLDQSKIAQRYKISPSYGDTRQHLRPSEWKDESEETVSGPIVNLDRYLLAIAIDFTNTVDHMDGDECGPSTRAYLIKGFSAVSDFSRIYGTPIVELAEVRGNGTWGRTITAEVGERF